MAERVPTAAGMAVVPMGYSVAYTVTDATTEIPLVVYACHTCWALTMNPPGHQRDAHDGVITV